MPIYKHMGHNYWVRIQFGREQMASSVQSDWAGVPADILNRILDELPSVYDYANVAAVCSHWFTVAALNKQHWRLHHRCLPLLLIPTRDGSKDRRSLYDVASSSLLRGGGGVSIPPPYNKRCCGSSHGWLAVSHRTEGILAISLFNPFSGAAIRLPEIVERWMDAQSVEDEFQISKVVLSADPTDGIFEAVAIYGGMRRLVLYRSGEKEWIHVPKKARIPMTYRSGGKVCTELKPTPFGCTDVIHYKGQFYAMNNWGWLISLRVAMRVRPYLRVTSVVPATRFLSSSLKTYIVESTKGDLLLLRRFDPNERKPFTAFKLMDSTGLTYYHEELQTIGDDAVFVGDSHSFAVKASEFEGCRRSCIYYTDDFISVPPPYQDGPTDMGVFSLEDGSDVNHYIKDDAHDRLPPPVWITPTYL